MKVLIVDDMPVIRDPIAAALRAAGYETLCVGSGKEAIQTVSAERPNLILLDIVLPDIDGLTVLRAIRTSFSAAELPVILLSSQEQRDSIIRASKLGAQEYLLKSRFSMKELLSRLEKYAAGTTTSGSEANPAAPQPAGKEGTIGFGQIPQLLTRETFFERTKTAMKAKTLSGVVAQVISLATAPRTELADLAAVVSRDVLLATRVLQAANSAAYRSARGTCHTIADAIRQVGCSTIRNIAAAVGIFEAMPDTASDGFNPIRCWQHSFAVARLCEMFATLIGQNPGTAYLVGLCHDLGEIILRTQFGNEYRQIIEWEKATGVNRDELELKMLGMTHGELINTILTCFNLPDVVREPIEQFHNNSKSASLGSPRTLESMLGIAEWYANGILLASSESAQISLLTTEQCKNAFGVETPPRPDTQKLRDEIMALTGMLARLSPTEEAELMKPLLSQAATRVWAVGDGAISTLDPASSALSCLTQCQIKPELPPDEALEQLDLLVLLGDAATEITAKAATVPTLRILTSEAKPEHPSSLCSPFTLAQLNEYCAMLRAKKNAA
jgi:HD-like signal output (HDOD) protein/DNA-binding response OmpR family regulator